MKVFNCNAKELLVNAWVSTHSEQTNSTGKDLSRKGKYWGKLKSTALGPFLSQLHQPKRGMQVLWLESKPA